MCPWYTSVIMQVQTDDDVFLLRYMSGKVFDLWV